MAIYLKYGDIVGDTTTDTVADWIELDSFQFGVGRGIGSGRGGQTREASEASVSEIVVTKQLDKASGPLLEQSLWGEGKDATIKFGRTKAGSAGTDFYLEYELGKTMISGYSVSSGGDRPTESISLNFNTFKINLDLGGLDNKAEGGFKTGYDLGTSKKL